MKKKSIFIYGAGEAGVSTIYSLGKFIKELNIIGFIDDDLNKVGSKINGIKVFSFNQFIELDFINDRTEVIISSEFINNDKREILIEFCNRKKIIVKKIPEYRYWTNENEFRPEKISKLKISDLLERREIKVNFQRIRSYLFEKTILITGGAGSIGSQIVLSVIEHNPTHIIIIDINENSLYNLELELKDLNIKSNCKVDFFTIDVKDKVSLSYVFEKFNPEIIFHAAAYKHVPVMENNPLRAISNNILGTYNLLELSKNFNTSKFVFISTDKAINPTNIMGATKRYSECLVQFFALENKNCTYVTTRFGNVLGSNGSVIPRFQSLIEKNKDIEVTHPDIIRYFMTIEEACNLVLEASTMAKNREIFVFDMGKPCKINDLAIKLIKLNGLEPNFDIKIKYTGLRPGEKLMEELLANDDNTIKTHHPKILKAKSRKINYDIYIENLNFLRDCIEKNNSLEAVKILKSCLPEFISNNSKYSIFDN